MRAVLGLVIVSMVCMGLTGCGLYQAPVMPPIGIVYTGVKAPLDTDMANTPVTGKKGTASSVYVLGLIATGDASIKAAADDGGITKVEHVDYEYFNVLFVFSRFTTIVYGQ
ncbi:MAG: hypothetical protein FJ278_14130 [Planctomycetes bacterium]|nr:hypothetical protein [Planctomycetota bacterium]